MATAAARQLFHLRCNTTSHPPLSCCSRPQRILFSRNNNHHSSNKLTYRMSTPIVSEASTQSNNIVESDEGDDGVSLGTMKLPFDTDIPRFESLLFQWANSLCQGANLPLPMPLKVDKIGGGARLGFIKIEDGKTETLVYIDCLVFPSTDGSAPIFRAIRNGPAKDQSPPGEPRIMKSLLQALAKSVEIARV